VLASAEGLEVESGCYSTRGHILVWFLWDPGSDGHCVRK
jgi:hypothetical protein